MATSWRKREANRFNCGKYEAPPWHKRDADNFLLAVPEHYAHVSQDDPTQLAYTPNPKYGEIDRHIRIKPGRYLQKFYPNLSATEISTYVGEWKAKTGIKVRFASDPDEIRWVYETGPNSCMSCSRREFKLPHHPTEAYGGGDLAVAYFTDTKGRRARARSVVWPDRSLRGPIYGDYDTLGPLLNEQGYQNEPGRPWNGARMLALRLGQTGFIAPYLDIHDTYVATPNGELFIGEIPKGVSSEGLRYLDGCNTGGRIGGMYCYRCDAYSYQPTRTLTSGRVVCENCEHYIEECPSCGGECLGADLIDTTGCTACVRHCHSCRQWVSIEHFSRRRTGIFNYCCDPCRVDDPNLN